MKRLFLILTIVLSLFILISCQEIEKNTVIFEHDEEIVHYIGSTRPNYLNIVKATFEPEGKNLSGLLMFDDTDVNYTTAGSYDVLFYLTYQSVRYESTAVVKVMSKTVDPEATIDFNFYYINDLHGAVLEDNDSIGLSKIGNLILDEKTNNPDTTLFLAGGDILQGQIFSNWYTGASVIDILNRLNLDAYVIGNHEFDWGIEQVTQYFNGQNELQANFPFLGANVYRKDTNARMEDLEPYTIIEKSGVKIAVIGTIGLGLESSITYGRVQDYEFVDPVQLTGYWAEYARVNDGADIVVAINHQDASYYNSQVAQFTGLKQVDAIFNGHTHYAYVRTETTSHGKVNIIQSGANGTNVGKVTLTYDPNDGVIETNAINLNRNNEARLKTENPLIKSIVESYTDEISNLYEPIIKSGFDYSQNDLTYYIAELMQRYTNADFGVHNFGGTRTSIDKNEDISYAKLFQISPFDNTVATVRVKGSVINQLSGVAVYKKAGLGSINNETYYTVATNDYVLGNNYSLRIGDNVIYTGKAVLDLMDEVIRNQKENGANVWSTSLPIIFDSMLSFNVAFVQTKKETYL